MAKYSARFSEIDMSDLDLSDVVRGQGSTTNAHTLKISYGGGDATTIKGDFDLNGKGFAVGGTITRISFEDDDHYGTTISGIKIDLNDFVKVAKSKSSADDAALFAKMFAGNDTMTGAVDDDHIRGFAGNDKLTGGFGEDRLDGGDGSDTLTGGDNADVLTGGLGADIFVYRNELDSTDQDADTITDFSQAQGDKISLRELGFFDFDTEIRVSHTASQTIVEVDVMGGFSFPLFIRIDGQINLTASDFLL